MVKSGEVLGTLTSPISMSKVGFERAGGLGGPVTSDSVQPDYNRVPVLEKRSTGETSTGKTKESEVSNEGNHDRPRLAKCEGRFAKGITS